MSRTEELIEIMDELSKAELRSELLEMCAENIDLINTIKSLKRKASVISAGVIMSCARFLDDEERAECLYTIDKRLFKEGGK